MRGHSDVILVDLRDGDSLAYNHAYENLRLGAIASALASANRTFRFADLNDLQSVVTESTRPLVVLDAFFRAAADVHQALTCIRIANPSAQVLLFGRAARTIAETPELRDLVDHFEYVDEVAAVLRLVGAPTISWQETTPHRPSPRGWVERGVIDVEATRGCQHHCTFCGVDASDASDRPTLWRSRQPKAVVHEIQFLVDQTGITRFQFVDDNLLGSPNRAPSWITEFAREISKANVDIKFSMYARLDHTLVTLLPSLRDCGLVQVHVGVEAGSDEILRRLRKGITTAQMEKAMHDVRKYDVELIASLIAFEPRMTPQELSESLAWIGRVGLERFFSLTTAIPFFGTKLRHDLEERGVALQSRPEMLGFPVTFGFVDHQVQRAYDDAKSWQELHHPRGAHTLEELMRQRFSYEERLGVLDDPDPNWLKALTDYRTDQMAAVQDRLRANA